MTKLNAETVIRQVHSSIWTFSVPFARFGLFPVGGRSTAIRLQSGGVWVCASSPLNDVTKKKLDELGPIKYLIAPDMLHYLFLSDFKEAYPEAKVIGVHSLAEKIAHKVKLDGAYGSDPEDTKYGYEDEIQALYIPAHINKEVAFLHKPSKTLIEADLLFNLPATEQYSKTSKPFLLGVSGYMSPFQNFHKTMINSVSDDKMAMRTSATTIAGWDFDRIIPCHGDVIETDGNKAWREAYKHFIDV